MKLMKLPELRSVGAWLTSMFDQLFCGKSGSGSGMLPPWTAAANVGTAARRQRKSAVRRIRRDHDRREGEGLCAGSLERSAISDQANLGRSVARPPDR